jgi:transcriptional regulator of nitric oxide reductase
MSTVNTPGSLHKYLVILGLLAVAILFDDGGSMMTGFSFDDGVQEASAQAAGATDAILQLLEEVIPGADNFSEKEGQPPAFKGYRTDPVSEEQQLAGYAFLTVDVPPEEVGYSGPIEVLVGMDLEGRITGIKVLHYTESIRRIWGDFLSIPGYQEQFAGKHISDTFRVGRDIDGISRATITVRAMSIGIRNSARRVAEAYL